MKFTCPCGLTMHDDGVAQPEKAHLRPDLSDGRHAELVRAEVEMTVRAHRKVSPDSEGKLQRALNELGMIGTHLERAAYECPGCGRLHVTDPSGTLRSYVPESDTRGVLRPSN